MDQNGNADKTTIDDDVRTLHALGYGQELARRMSAFSNFAISLSIICILSGGITSFHLGLCSVGGASIGLGWPLVSLLALALAATMGQLASAFPTAGGLYHWGSILGGRGWGWATAWFNLAGLVTALAAVNVGAYEFVVRAFGPFLGFDVEGADGWTKDIIQFLAVLAITFSHAYFNHKGIRTTTLLTDFSGYLILVVAVLLTAALLFFAPSLDVSRLVAFSNYSGIPAPDPVWPRTESLWLLFALGFMLPAYTITGFDASAHTAEETLGAARAAPRGIVQSVWVSGLFGWMMLVALVLAIPDMDLAAQQGGQVFYWIIMEVLPVWLVLPLFFGIAVAQYCCGLACLTSASRMVYAFARDGGLPRSALLRRVSPTHRTPSAAIWAVAATAVAFTVFTPVYSTITTVCVIFLDASYVMPTVSGLLTIGRSWTKMGPWTLGRWYRPLAVVCVVGGIVLFVIGVQPPNDKALWIVLGMAGLLTLYWCVYKRRHFEGPPQGVFIQTRQAEILAEEKAVGQVS
jgi:amino acid transporter